MSPSKVWVKDFYHQCGDICLSPIKVPVDFSVDLFVTNKMAQGENPVLGPPTSMVMNFLWSIWSYYTAVKSPTKNPPPWQNTFVTSAHVNILHRGPSRGFFNEVQARVLHQSPSPGSLLGVPQMGLRQSHLSRFPPRSLTRTPRWGPFSGSLTGAPAKVLQDILNYQRTYMYA